MPARCAVELALLDVAGKRSGMPVHDLLGLGFKEGQHVTSFTIGIDRADVIRKQGSGSGRFSCLEMKVGVPEDKANLQALREVAPTNWCVWTPTKAGRRKEHAWR